MKLIQENPYRIAGILANASAREVVRQKSRISMSAEIGRQIDSKFDFPFLPPVDRTDINKVNKAFSCIEQNQDKVNQSLFWFLNANPFDETAINYLINGDKEKACEIWKKRTNGEKISSKNYSCLNNIGTLKLIGESKQEIIEGIEAKINLIESNSFTYFIQAVADQNYTINNQKQAEKFIDDILKQFKGKYSIADILKLFSNCNGTIQKYLSQKFTEEPLHKIESQIEASKKNRKVNKGNAYEFGLKLFTNTKEDLSLLKTIVGTNDLNYKTVADQLANEIMQCGIDYFNESQRNNLSLNYLEPALRLTKFADSIAVGKLAKDRAKDSLATLEEMKDREINNALALLNSIKEAYDRACGQIDAEVERVQQSYYGGTRITIPMYGVSINWSKVEKMKRNALDWDKVVEVIGNGISKNDVAIIQRCVNSAKVSEYKRLVEFLFNMLGPIQINKIKYICFWRDVTTTQVISTAKKVGRTINSATESKCYIATMAYGDYANPQVLELRKFRDDFLSKNIIGRKFIMFYYKFSPRMVEILKNNQRINLIIRKILDQFIKTIRK